MSSQAHKIKDCPIKLEYCYPSCTFWRDKKCQYRKIVREMRGEVPPNPVGAIYEDH